MDSWRAEDATRQAHRRDANEADEDCLGARGALGRMNVFVCECGDPACTTTVCLSSREYENVRAFPNHFAIATNHENPEVEWVVAETERFAIVETLAGEASKIALRTDPRALDTAGTGATP